MATRKQTPTDAIARQIETIDAARQRLHDELRKITGQINPDTATWNDVATFAKAAELAATLVSQLDEK